MSLDVSTYISDNVRDPYVYEVTEGQRRPVACQLVRSGNSGIVYFVLEGKTLAHTSRQYVMRFGKASEPRQPVMSMQDNQEFLVLRQEGRPILSYRYTLAPVPEGVNPIFRRSGFIHPAWTPSGFVLTAIQPRDLRHH